MIIYQQELHLNPTEVLVAKSINSFNFELVQHPNGFHKILRLSSERQRDYWAEQIMLAVDEIVMAESAS